MLKGNRHYPTFWAAVHLVVLYIFLHSLVDFPLSLYDYYNGTDWLHSVAIKAPLFFGITAFILYLGYRFSNTPVRSVFTARPFPALSIAGMVFVFVGLQHFLFGINTVLDSFLPAPVWFIELLEHVVGPKKSALGSILRVVIIAPVVEELMFRGVIMDGFLRNYSRLRAVLYSALLFSLFHLNPWQLPSTFFLGLVLGVVKVRTGSTLACITGHAIYNGFVLLSIWFPEEFSRVTFSQYGAGVSYLFNGLLLLLGLSVIVMSTRQGCKARARRGSFAFF